MAAPADRTKALDNALAQIERSFGKGSVMRLGEEGRAPVEGRLPVEGLVDAEGARPPDEGRNPRSSPSGATDGR